MKKMNEIKISKKDVDAAYAKLSKKARKEIDSLSRGEVGSLKPGKVIEPYRKRGTRENVMNSWRKGKYE